MPLSLLSSIAAGQCSCLPETRVLILDKNQYFAKGLGDFIQQYHRNKGRRTAAQPVIVFFTFKTFWELPLELLARRIPSIFLICIAERRQTEECSIPLYPWIPILYRDMPLSGIQRVIEQASFPAHASDAERFPGTGKLTLRETEILAGLAAGFSVTEVSKRFCIKEKTVSTYKRRAMKKLGFRTFHQLCGWLNCTQESP